jgi:diaminopimelate decarboxylase
MATRKNPIEHAPMTQFPVEDGRLVIGGIPLDRLAARVGRTPFYAYDRRLVAERVKALRNVLPRGVRLHYAMKANPMPALVGFMVGLVDGVDVASANELRVALDADANPRELSIAGPGKADREIAQAVASGILTNIESEREVDVLARAARDLGMPARVAVRINPDFDLKGSGMSMGGGPKQFGVDVERVPQLLDAIGAAGLAFEGFHIFAGSQSLNAAAIVEAQRLSFELVKKLASRAPRPVKVVNLGGGFGIPYFPGDRRLDLAPIGANLETLAAEARSALPGAELVLELGRYLVGEAGVYVARVIDRKVSRGRIYLVTDGGLHHHLAASGNFGQVVRKNYPVAIGTNMTGVDGEPCWVVGPLCTPLDVLASEVVLPAARAGDLIVVYLSGAYGATASPQAFLSHPPVIEVLV